MARPVYIAGVGLTKVDLTGRVFGSVFDLFAEACEKALRHLSVTELGMPLDQQRDILAAMVAAYVESNDLCPLCGGPPHPKEP